MILAEIYQDVQSCTSAKCYMYISTFKTHSQMINSKLKKTNFTRKKKKKEEKKKK